MSKAKTLEEAYDKCVSSGFYNEKTPFNEEKASSLTANAESMIMTAEIAVKGLTKEQSWLGVYSLYYEALRTYVEAYAGIADSLSCINHQCLFAYLCIKHPELELDWDFFEKIRTKRNGVNYYGENITYEDWKTAEIQVKLYINTIKKEIKGKLKQS